MTGSSIPIDRSELSEEDTEAILAQCVTRIHELRATRYVKRRYRKGDGYVYFVQMGEDGPIKIGYSKEFLQRVYDLQVGSPYELKILFAMRAFPETELRLHAKFRAHHMRGEWFRSCNEIFSYILDNFHVTEYLRPSSQIIEDNAMAMTTKFTSFNYSSLSKDVSGKVMCKVAEIRKSLSVHAKSGFELGKELSELKKLFSDEKAFVECVAKEIGFAKSTIYNYIGAWKAFGDFPNFGKIEPSAMYLLKSNEAASDMAKDCANKGETVTFTRAKEIIADCQPKPPRIAAPPIEDAEFKVVESTEADSPKDEPPAPPKPIPPKPPVSEKDYGTCPNCAGTKWTTDDDGTACSRCHHPHGEPVGDKDDDDAERAKIQRAKTVKTVEALMRAFDDLQLLIPLSRVHDEALAGCKVLLKLAKGWQ